MKISATGWAKIGALTAVALYLGGCSEAYEPISQVHDLKSESVITGTASLTHTFVLDRKTGFVTCTMPPPDAAFSQQEQGDISISVIAIGSNSKADSGAAEEGSSEDELVGRTPSVMMARELFFRLCEFSRNYDLKKDEAIKLYRETLGTVKEVWSKEAANTTIKIGENVTTNVSETAGGKAAALPSPTAAPSPGSSNTPSSSSGTASSTDDSTTTDSSSSTDNSSTNPFGN